jgi:hypothetical protein
MPNLAYKYAVFGIILQRIILKIFKTKKQIIEYQQYNS